MLRKALSLVPLPLTSLENPTPFSLPIVHISKVTENLVSGSSSAKSTTSDISASLVACDKAGKEEENEEESSPAITSNRNNLVAVGSSNSEADFSSNSEHEYNSEHEVANKNHDRLHMPESIQECSDTDYLSSRISTSAEFNLDEFNKYFPELEVSQDNLTFPCSPSSGPGKGPTEKPPVVVVPTAALTTLTSETKLNTEKFSFKTAVHFVEEPAPQIMGHIPPTKPEPVYHKSLSVDRLVWMMMSVVFFY